MIDELSMSGVICAMQELFLVYAFDVNTPEFKRSYDLLLPFDLWKPRSWWLRWAPTSISSDAAMARRYLKIAERLARRRSAAGFCFKVLSHHFEQRPYLKHLLRQRGYRVVFLTRNPARQVLSGMVAAQRGVYNALEPVGTPQPHHIDVERFAELVLWERQAAEQDRARLLEWGFAFVAVSYEGFIKDRQSFYSSIGDFLEVPIGTPPSSDFSIMIPDMRDAIENYDAVADRTAAMGLALES